jgi:hypothetical protein
VRTSAKISSFIKFSNNGSKTAQFNPGQPRRTKSHGGAHHRCLFTSQLDVPGALSKPGNHLLRLAAAQPQMGLTSLFDSPYARCKMGCREKLPDPSDI